MTLLILAIFIGFTQTASAQTKSEGDIIINSDRVVFDKDPKFVCTQLTYNDKTQVMTLTGNVSLKTDKFEFADAGKVVYNEKTRKLVIYNSRGFTIDGKIVLQDNVSKAKTVEYTLGDDTAYVL